MVFILKNEQNRILLQNIEWTYLIYFNRRFEFLPDFDLCPVDGGDLIGVENLKNHTARLMQVYRRVIMTRRQEC